MEPFKLRLSKGRFMSGYFLLDSIVHQNTLQHGPFGILFGRKKGRERKRIALIQLQLTFLLKASPKLIKHELLVTLNFCKFLFLCFFVFNF